METRVQTYPCNTLEDLEKIPDWILSSLNLGYGHRVPPQVENSIIEFGQAIFDSTVFSDQVISNYDERIKVLIQKSELSSLLNLMSEQRHYFYELRQNEIKEDIIRRIKKREYYTDQLYRREESCSIWITVASINDQPYGGVFTFYSSKYPESVMIQGISKFLTAGAFSLFYPELAKRLPKLNSLLLPAVETLAVNLGTRKIIVNPIGIQGRLLEQYYGFRPILEYEKKQAPCSLIQPQLGFREHTDSWFEKEISPN